MKDSLKRACSFTFALTMLTTILTSCGKKVEYIPTDVPQTTAFDNVIQQASKEDSNDTAADNGTNNSSSVGGDSSYSNGGSSYTGGDSSYAGGGSSYSSSSSSDNDTTLSNQGNSSTTESTTKKKSIFSNLFSKEDKTTTTSAKTTTQAKVTTTKASKTTAKATTTTKVTTTVKVTATTVYKYDINKVLNSAPLTPMKTNDSDLDGRIDEIFAEILNDSMSVYDKVKTIYNYLVQTNRYGYMAQTSSSSNYISLYDREAVGRAKSLLKYKTGDCIDFAATFMCMTRRIGLNCYFIDGEVTNADGYTSRHGWNVIRINGYDYVFDAQKDFRDASGGPTKYTQFGIYQPEKFDVSYTDKAAKKFKKFKTL